MSRRSGIGESILGLDNASNWWGLGLRRCARRLSTPKASPRIHPGDSERAATLDGERSYASLLAAPAAHPKPCDALQTVSVGMWRPARTSLIRVTNRHRALHLRVVGRHRRSIHRHHGPMRTHR